MPPLQEYSLKRGFSPLRTPRAWPTPANRRAARLQSELFALCDAIIDSRRDRDDRDGRARIRESPADLLEMVEENPDLSCFAAPRFEEVGGAIGDVAQPRLGGAGEDSRLAPQADVLLLFSPIFFKDEAVVPLETVELRREQLKGFVIVAFRIGEANHIVTRGSLHASIQMSALQRVAIT